MGQTVMFYVFRYGSYTLLDYLLEKNMDINESDNLRQTPLFYAVKYNRYKFIKYAV